MNSEEQQFKESVLKWLTKKREANKGSKIEFVYAKAGKSLKECENSISTVNDLLAVKNFGPKICQKIARELKLDFGEDEVLCEDEPTQSSSSQQKTKEVGGTQKRIAKVMNPSGTTGESPLRKKRTYCPKPNSGGYAILRALYEAEKEGHSSLAKNELMVSAQTYSNESMAKPKCGSYYTAWSSMTTLIKHGLVVAEKHRFANYSLTDEGMNIAQKIINYETRTLCPIDENSDSSSPPEDSHTLNPVSNSHVQSSCERVIMFPNSFDIILIIDSREQHSGVPNAYKKTALLSQLQQEGVLCEMKALPVGDFAWIARKKSTGTSRGPIKDLIFDFVIERKRIDDLARSIIDNRWKEQKFRLKQAGVRKPTYLIEEFSVHSRKLYTVPFERMETSLVNSELYDGVEFVYTKNHSHTLSYLVTMSKALKRMYASKTLYSCTKDEIANNNNVLENHFMTFCEFERSSTKITNFTVGEMFAKLLLQFKGISVAKAKTITEHYPTLSRLLDAYEICESDKDRKELLSSFVCGERKIGAVVSNKVFVGWYTSI